MRAPRSANRGEDKSSGQRLTHTVAERAGSCPHACVKFHRPVYYRRALSAEDVAATICSVCDTAYTRTQLLTLFTDVRPAPDEA